MLLMQDPELLLVDEAGTLRALGLDAGGFGFDVAGQGFFERKIASGDVSRRVVCFAFFHG